MEEIKAPYIKQNGKHIKPSSAWRKVQKDGYINIRDSKGKWVREHRLIMEEILGRKLEVWEIVHHFDSNKSNNNRDNLVFCESNTSHAIMHNFQKYNDFKLGSENLMFMFFTSLKNMGIYSKCFYPKYHQELRRNDKVVYIKNQF